jgi:hypothetical protein
LALKKNARTEIVAAATGDAAAGQKVTEAVEAAAADAQMQGAVAEALAEDAAAETKNELREMDAEAAKETSMVEEVEEFITGSKQKREIEDKLGEQEEKLNAAQAQQKQEIEDKLGEQEEKLNATQAQQKQEMEQKLDSVVSEVKIAQEEKLNATQVELAAAMAEETDRLKKEMEEMRSVQTLEAKQAYKSENLMAVVGVFLLLIFGGCCPIFFPSFPVWRKPPSLWRVSLPVGPPLSLPLPFVSSVGQTDHLPTVRLSRQV